METEILRRLAEEELYEAASVESYNSAASRIRAAAAAAQPMAFSILNSVHGRGGGASLFPGAGQSAMLNGPSLYDVALMQQRLALDEQSRMRAMAQAAAAMHQQQQQQHLLQRSHNQQQEKQRNLQEHRHRSLKRERDDLKVSEALRRLVKKRKVIDQPPLNVAKKKNKIAGSNEFLLPKLKGKDVAPPILPMLDFRRHWDMLVEKAKTSGGTDDEQYAFVRHHFGLILAQNRGLKNDKSSGNENTSMVVTV